MSAHLLVDFDGKKSMTTDRAMRQMAEWANRGGGRRVSVAPVIISHSYPKADDILDRKGKSEGLWWEVRLSIGESDESDDAGVAVRVCCRTVGAAWLQAMARLREMVE